MAALSRWSFITNNFAVKLLSLAVAVIFWFSVAAEKETIVDYSVPLQVKNIPPGLALVGNVPKTIKISLAGPRILFVIHPLPKRPVVLDLHGTGKGVVTFTDLRKYIDVPEGIQTIKVYPSRLELGLE